ncbi:adenosylcobalamin-dependent ribonucleoside-diphosphate reductase [Candidatus Microgenomates bacterium]|nr:adenosylcobalamin-dependent ribonucleoside-diphosphate reductase [Candidatus Microgenomates bacterium]
METGTKLDGIRGDVFLDRYSLKDVDGTALEMFPEQMWARVAWGISQVEKPGVQKLWEEKFYEALKGFKFVPAGRILSGAGTGYEVTYYNCYVIPSPHDSRHGIMTNIELTVEIQARGGGVGVNLSSLRPQGARVRKVNGTSSGPVNWAVLYSTANHDVIQQGGSRRGALMLMINDWHPDVLEFITVKQDLTKIPGANLSVCVSNAFMEAVKNDSDWQLIYPDLDTPGYDELWDGDIEKWKGRGLPVKVYNTVKARYIWDLIAEAAWRSAEPGVVFIDRYNDMSNLWYGEKIIATNPCGEQGLGAWGVCNLGHVNLEPFVKEGKFDYEGLREHVAIATRFLDNVVDANLYFAPENEEAQKNGIRRIGLGTLGLADALIKMSIRYGTKESLDTIEKIYKVIRDTAYDTSADISREKGPFGKFEGDKYLQSKFVQTLPDEIQEKIGKYGIRNGILLTQAPTGTVSLLSGVSSGIEPVYEFTYKRNDRTGEHIVRHPLLEAWMAAHPGQEIPDYFVSASGLTPEEHVEVQAMVQKYTDASISKTVNAPNSHTVEDVKKLYNMAYELGCKGVTYFRDGSRTGVLSKIDDVNTSTEKPKSIASIAEVTAEPVRPRPVKVNGTTYRLNTPVGSAFITINEDENGEPVEVFLNVGKAGSDVTAMAEALGRMISTSLRFRGHLSAKDKVKEIADQLSGIGGRRSVGLGPDRVRSLPDAVAAALAMRYGDYLNGVAQKILGDPAAAGMPVDNHPIGEPGMSASVVQKKAFDICPSCGAGSLVYEEGCAKCYECGHSEC